MYLYDRYLYRYRSFRQFKTVSTVKIFSSENIFTVDPGFLMYLSTFFHLSNHMAFVHSVRRCLGVLVYDLRPRSSCPDVLTVFGSTFSSAAILRMDVVGSIAILVLRAWMESWFRFLLTPVLPRFLWMPLPMSMVSSTSPNYVGNAFRVFLCKKQVWYSTVYPSVKPFSMILKKNRCLLIVHSMLFVFGWFLIIWC